MTHEARDARFAAESMYQSMIRPYPPIDFCKQNLVYESIRFTNKNFYLQLDHNHIQSILLQKIS